MNLTDQLTDYIHAAFSGLWVSPRSPTRPNARSSSTPASNNWKVAVWDIANGLRLPSSPEHVRGDAGPGDPLAALRALPSLADANGTALLVLHNFHRFLTNPEVIQTTFTQLVAGKQQRTFLVVLSPVVQIPIELEKLFVVIEHTLPDREQLERIARELTSDSPEDLPQGTDLQRVLDAAAGLTRYEAEGAFALSLTRHNALRPEAIWELKAQALAKSGLCELYRGEPRSFESLRGVDHVRRLTAQLLRPDCPVPPQGLAVRRPAQRRQDERGQGHRRRQRPAPAPGRPPLPEGEVRRRVRVARCAASSPCARPWPPAACCWTRSRTPWPAPLPSRPGTRACRAISSPPS